MRNRFLGMAIGLFVLLFAVGAGGPAAAQQGNQNQNGTPPMSLAPPSGPSSADQKEFLNNELRFRVFEAIAGDASSCQGDSHCLKTVENAKALLCASNVCDGTGQGKEPTACFNGAFDQSDVSTKERISQSICSFIKSHDAESRQALVSLIPDITADELVQYEAIVLALKGSSKQCEDTIKSYVGAYGSNWNIDWYRVLAGCRILTHESTSENAEKDFYTWSQASAGHCSDITNPEIRSACGSPDATFPAFRND